MFHRTLKPAVVLLFVLVLAQLACTVPGLVASATATPAPTDTPAPTATTAVTDTPAPTDTPEATSTPKSSPTAKPTATRKPTRTPTQAPTPITGPLADAILAPIYANLEASVDEDLEAYMATIHPDSPGYASTERLMEQMFDLYDLSYEVGAVAVLSVEDGEARVSFVLTTRKVRGPDFKDNEITGVFILRQDGDEWKVYNQEIENIKYLP